MPRLLPALAAALCIASVAWGAQPAFCTSPPNLAAYATVASLQALATTMPAPCVATPLPDTLLGALGSGTPCSPRQDTARPTVVQAANVITDASGNWSVTWAKPFVSPVPAVNPLPVNTGTLPILCNVQTRSTTGATGRCWQANTTTLPGTLTALTGLVLNAFQSGAANAAVMVIAREVTQ